MQHNPSEPVKRDEEPRVIVFEVIDVMTRAEMLANGDLVAVPKMVAWNAGFRAPVALTRAAWLAVVHDPESDAAPAPDDLNRPLSNHERLRLRVVCARAALQAAFAPKEKLQAADLRFEVSGEPLWLHVGHDEDGEVVFTVMREEDR